MVRFSILASASPTGLNRQKLDSNSILNRSQLLTQGGGEGSNNAGSNYPRADPVRKDRAYVTLAVSLEKMLVQS